MGNMMKPATSSTKTEDNHEEIVIPMDEEILTVPISQSVYEILKARENYLCDLLKKKFGCITILKNTRNSKELYRKYLKEGIEVSVWVGDLTNHEADAVVNAANENLFHSGGLAYSLLKAGGPEIEQQCKQFIDKNGPCSAGQIAVTTGGRLYCKQLIHAVGPRWSEDRKEECCLKLETAIINILQYANAPENHIKSVAIPALSSGFFLFPRELSAQVILRTIKNFIQLAPLFGYLQEIHLVNIDQGTAKTMKRICEELFGDNAIGTLKGPLDSITINDLYLQIEKGHIEKQKTAIIINSVIMQDLSKGTISRAILEKAGPPMLNQFLSEFQKLDSGCINLICTKGYKINCEFVFHIVWPPFNKGNSQQVLSTAISKSLYKTQEQFPSVSFPPLGIDDLHLPKDEAVDIVVDEIIHFAEECPGKKIDVHIVIPPHDNDVYEAFHTKLISVKKYLEEKMDCSDMDATDLQMMVQASTCEKIGPFVELIGYNHDALEEAKLCLEYLIEVEQTHQIVIQNYNILNLGNDKLYQLQQQFDVKMNSNGTALEIEGSPSNVLDATFSIELMLHDTGKQELLKTDGVMKNNSHPEYHTDTVNKPCYEVTPIESYLQEFKNKEKQLEKVGLRVLKVEKISNPVLETTFQRIKKKIEEKNTGMPVCHRLYHSVPAQYCNLVCKNGFQTTYFSSQDKKYGSGIYFKKNPRNLMTNIGGKCEMDHLICIFEAEVVTGSYTKGNQSYMAPPLINARSMKLYDSVVDDIYNPDVFVIFNKDQSLPLYLLTCSLLWNPEQTTNLESEFENP